MLMTPIQQRLIDVLHYVKACLPQKPLATCIAPKDLLLSSFDASLSNVETVQDDPEVWIKVQRVVKLPLPNVPEALQRYVEQKTNKLKRPTEAQLKPHWESLLQEHVLMDHAWDRSYRFAEDGSVVCLPSSFEEDVSFFDSPPQKPLEGERLASDDSLLSTALPSTTPPSTAPSTIGPLTQHRLLPSDESQRILKTFERDKQMLVKAFESYSQEWKKAQEHNESRKQEIETYEKLFDLYNSLKNDGGAETFEVVCGMAHVVWKKSNGELVNYPLIVQPCEVTFDPLTSSLEIRPAQAEAYLHAGVWGEAHRHQGLAVEHYWQEHKQEMDLLPFDPSSYRTVAQACAGLLDASGHWVEEMAFEGAYGVQAQAPVGLSIVPLWTFFARERPFDRLEKDITRWENEIRQSTLEDVPVFLRQMVGEDVAPPEEEEVLYRGLEPLPYSSQNPDTPVRDLYFPLPYNNEQVRVIQRLAQGSGAVIQGPPGTGKSHTIANVICHYLAQGKRVLVTSEAATALDVVREKIPENIRMLSVALLSSDAESLKDFERSIQTIAHRLNVMDVDKSHLHLEQLQKRLDQAHHDISNIDHTLHALAEEHENFPLSEDSSSSLDDFWASFAEATDASSTRAPLEAWLSDNDLHVVEEGVIEQRARRMRKLWAEVGEDFAFVEQGVPLKLPSLLEAGQLHSCWQERKQIIQNDQPYWDRWKEASLDGLREAAEAWKDAILERHKATASQDVQAAQRMVHPKTGTMQGFFGTFNNYYISFRRDIGRVDFDPQVLKHAETLEHIKHLAQGGSLGMKLLFNSESKRLLQSVTLDGAAVALGKSKESWNIVSQRIQEHTKVHTIKNIWKQKCQEPHLQDLPQHYEEAMAFMQQYNVLCQALMREYARQEDFLQLWDRHIGLSFEDTVLAWREHRGDEERESEEQTEDSEISSCSDVDLYLNVLDRMGAQQARIQRQEVLAERLQQVQHIQNQAWGGMTDVVRQTMPLLTHLSREDWLALWQNVLGYQQHLWSQQDGVEEIQNHLAWIRQQGAKTWADRLEAGLIQQAQRPDWMARALGGDGEGVGPKTPLSTEDGGGEGSDDVLFSLDDLLPLEAERFWKRKLSHQSFHQLPQKDRFDALFEQRRGLVDQLRRVYESIVEEKAWLSCAQSATRNTRQALQAYLNAVKKMGKGTGKRAKRYSVEAREAMQQAFGAIPCWIMPQGRVSESMPNTLGAFDLIVVDEASKSDITILPALLRGKKVLVVGDDKQVSPEAVGKEDESMVAKREQFLSHIPLRHQMTQDRSVYDLFLVLFVQDNISLREHFRSAIPIISFSNSHYYNDEMAMLRVPKAQERLDPVLVDLWVDQAQMYGEVNKAEAHAIAYEIKRLVQEPSMKERTIGVVSLSSKPKYIDYLRKAIDMTLQDVLTPQEQLKHRIAVGSPSFFQGMERDIMFVSTYYVGRDFLLDKEVDRQRTNVAMSRARDQMYLVRSMTMEQTRDGSILRQIMQHFSGYAVTQSQAVPLERMTGFEKQLYDFLKDKGYVVQPHVGDRQYAIDLVVEGPLGQRLAIECDGDGMGGTWRSSIQRQRVLERAGWEFWRCFWVDYVLRQDMHQKHLLARLTAMGIVPFDPPSQPSQPKRVLTWDHEREQIVRDSWIDELQLKAQHEANVQTNITRRVQSWMNENKPLDELRLLCESYLEQRVFDFLGERYRVQPQVTEGSYRMDLVVFDGTGNHLVVECDGETPQALIHAYEERGVALKTHCYEDDKARDAYLKRQGWDIKRIWGSDIHQRWDWVKEDLEGCLTKKGILRKNED